MAILVPDQMVEREDFTVAESTYTYDGAQRTRQKQQW
jgi:hypothetical protein